MTWLHSAHSLLCSLFLYSRASGTLCIRLIDNEIGEVRDLLFREYSFECVTPKAAVSLTLEQWGLMKALKMEGAGGRCAVMVSAECLCGIFDKIRSTVLKARRSANISKTQGQKWQFTQSILTEVSIWGHMITYNSFIIGLRWWEVTLPLQRRRESEKVWERREQS